MSNIVTTEWLKIKKYPAFWWVICITALSYPGITYIFLSVYEEILKEEGMAGQVAKMYIGNPFGFPDVWHTVAFFTSWFIFIPSVVVIMLITNEYTYKTHRQNIIDGWSRNTFMRAKLADVLIIALLVTLLYVASAFVTGMTVTGGEMTDKWSQFYYVGLFALQTFSQLSIAFLIGFLVRKAFIALGIFIFLFFPLEPILVALLREKSNDEGRFLPLEISDRMIPVPGFLGKMRIEDYNKALDQVTPHIFYTIILTTLIWALCFWIMNKRDL